MENQQPRQSSDDVTSAGGAASERAAEAVRRTERRARAKVKSAAESVREQAHTAGERAEAAGQTLGNQAKTWAEEARMEGAAAARAGERAARDISLGVNETTGHRYADMARNTAERIGSVMGRARSLTAEDVVAEVKRFVGQHPSSLLGALVAGFLFGRMMRGR